MSREMTTVEQAFLDLDSKARKALVALAENAGEHSNLELVLRTITLEGEDLDELSRGLSEAIQQGNECSFALLKMEAVADQIVVLLAAMSEENETERAK